MEEPSKFAIHEAARDGRSTSREAKTTPLPYCTPPDVVLLTQTLVTVVESLLSVSAPVHRESISRSYCAALIASKPENAIGKSETRRAKG